MKVVMDKRPRWVVRGGPKMNRGVSFGSEKDAVNHALVTVIMDALWKAKVTNGTSVYETALAMHAAWDRVAKVRANLIK